MENKEKNTTEISSSRPDGMVMQIVTSLLCIGIGALLLFVPSVNILYLCYCFCAALIVVGIILIVSYFVSEAYRKLNDYRFAVGVLLVILGCIELLRAQILSQEIMFIIGLVTLILAVIILQSTVQMKILKSGAWIVQLIFTVISLVGAIMVLVDFKPVMDRAPGFPYIVMLVVGTLCLISLVIEAVILWSVKRRETKAQSETTTEPAAEAVTETAAEEVSASGEGTEDTASDEMSEKDVEEGIGTTEADAP